MRRAPLALGALGLLDLVLVWWASRLGLRPVSAFPPVVVLAGAMACVVALGPDARALPLAKRSRNAVDAAGLIKVAGALLLPSPHLVALCLGVWLLGRRRLPMVRRVGNCLLELAAMIVASEVSLLVLHGAPTADLQRLALACLVAGACMSFISAGLVSLLSRFVDGVPFRAQVIWLPEHYARAQAFDLLGSLTAFLLLVSPWALLFVGAPQLLLAGLLVRDAGARAVAEQDAKTKLLNHPAFVARARAELEHASRNDEPVSALVLDLDHLREVNNRHGHPVGDRAIVAVADVLRRSLRAHDLAARVGGEEFLVLLPGTDLAGAVEVAERVRSSLAQTPVPAGAGEIVVTTSVGAAQAEEGEPWESLYERADRALLTAKASGRDRVEAQRELARE